MKYVALLRGINVGGRNMIKMETLRATLESLGFENVKSYINSGNLAFECGVDKGTSCDTGLADKIHDAIFKDFGFDISVIVRSMAEIAEIVRNNPFEGQFENAKDVHVFFLDAELDEGNKVLLLQQCNENEIYAVYKRHVFSLLKISILDSAVGKGYIDKKLKVVATARNWRTVKKLAEM